MITSNDTYHLASIRALCRDIVSRMVGYRTADAKVPELERVIEHAEAVAAANDELKVALRETQEELELCNRHYAISSVRLQAAGLKPVVYGDVTDENFLTLWDNGGRLEEGE